MKYTFEINTDNGTIKVSNSNGEYIVAEWIPGTPAITYIRQLNYYLEEYKLGVAKLN